jgi:hypothetical protein
VFEGRHYQNAYITRDIGSAIERFRRRSAVERVIAFEASVDLWTPRGRGAAVSKLAFIWIGDLQYELIQPVSGLVDIYRDALPADDGLKFHHTGTRVEDWADFRARVDEQDLPVVLEGGGDLLKFLYLDARQLVGHYLEYVWMTPERWVGMGGPNSSAGSAR